VATVDLSKASRHPDGYFIQFGPDREHLTLPDSNTLAFFRLFDDAQAAAWRFAEQGVRARVLWQPPDRDASEDSDVLLDTSARPTGVRVVYHSGGPAVDSCLSAIVGTDDGGRVWFRLVRSKGFDVPTVTRGADVVTALAFERGVNIAVHGAAAANAGGTIASVFQVRFQDAPGMSQYRTESPPVQFVARERQRAPRVAGLAVLVEKGVPLRNAAPPRPPMPARREPARPPRRPPQRR
jgi:hypothetical protein